MTQALAEAPGGRFATAGAFATALERRQAPRMSRRWRVWLAVGLVSVAGWGVMEWSRSLTTRHGAMSDVSLDPTRVAVLYFEDRSEAQAIPEVAAGLTEDVIDRLGEVPILRVTSAAGVRPYRGASASLDSIARVLDIGSVVTGTVIRSHDRLRVTVRLIDPRTRVQLNSQTVDRPWSDLLVIRDSIVDDVATMLRKALGREVRVRERREGTASALAWQLVQQADPLPDAAAERLRHGDQETAGALLHRADSLLTFAARLDPAWIVPPVQLARLAFTRAVFRWEEGQGPGRSAELLRADSRTGIAFTAEITRGVRYADQALADHPAAPAALEIRGRLRYTLWSYFGRPQGDTLLRLAETDLRAATLGDSSRAVAWFTLSELYRSLGRLPEADNAARMALGADAYLDQAPAVMADLFFSALTLEHWQDARDWCARGARQFPTRPNFVDCGLRVLGWVGAGRRDIADAWRALAAADRADSSPVLQADRQLMVAAVLARSGLADSARAVLRIAEASVVDPYVRLDMSYADAYVRLLLGERESALRLLGTYLEANPQERRSAAHHPWWRALRGDPRFQALIRPSA